MAGKLYRSAKGKSIDMGQLLSQNESVRAIGNMGVNARGDKIKGDNTVAKTRNEQVNKHYRKQITNQVVDVKPSANNFTNPHHHHHEQIDGLDTDIDAQETVTVEEKEQTVKQTAVQNLEQSVVEKESVIEEVAEEPVVEAPKPKATPKKKKTGGLAGAIAKAREVEKKKLQTEKESAKSKTGVNRI